MRKLFFSLCLLVPQLIAAQSANERVTTLINENRWFDLQRELQVTSDSLSPMLRTMSTALAKHYLNQPEAAIQSITTLLNQHQQEIGTENALNMAFLIGVNLARQGKYKDAAEHIQGLRAQLKAQQVDNSQTTGIQEVADRYKIYDDIGNICQPLHPAGTYSIPFFINNKIHEKKGGFIAMDGLLNRMPKHLIFDTGAGLNIISSKDADECGLRRIDHHVNMLGIGMQLGQVAIADTLRIGETIWQNVPFLIVDIVTGNAEIDKVMDKGLSPVIGLPILLPMKEVQIDFVKHTLTIPETPSPMPFEYSNMILKDNEGLRVESYDEHGKPLQMYLDTGSALCIMSAHWYSNHKDEVQAAGIPDSLRMAGVGGVVMQHSYLMKDMTFQIGTGKILLDSINIGTGIDLHTKQPLVNAPITAPGEDGVIGLELLEKAARVIINLQDMYIDVVPRKNE